MNIMEESIKLIDILVKHYSHILVLFFAYWAGVGNWQGTRPELVMAYGRALRFPGCRDLLTQKPFPDWEGLFLLLR